MVVVAGYTVSRQTSTEVSLPLQSGVMQLYQRRAGVSIRRAKLREEREGHSWLAASASRVILQNPDVGWWQKRGSALALGCVVGET